MKITIELDTAADGSQYVQNILHAVMEQERHKKVLQPATQPFDISKFMVGDNIALGGQNNGVDLNVFQPIPTEYATKAKEACETRIEQTITKLRGRPPKAKAEPALSKEDIEAAQAALFGAAIAAKKAEHVPTMEGSMFAPCATDDMSVSYVAPEEPKMINIEVPVVTKAEIMASQPVMDVGESFDFRSQETMKYDAVTPPPAPAQMKVDSTLPVLPENGVMTMDDFKALIRVSSKRSLGAALQIIAAPPYRYAVIANVPDQHRNELARKIIEATLLVDGVDYVSQK
jgi:hypothetical protein